MSERGAARVIPGPSIVTVAVVVNHQDRQLAGRDGSVMVRVERPETSAIGLSTTAAVLRDIS